MEKFSVSIEEAIKALQQQSDKPFITILKDKKMSIEYFAPKNIDTQQPHAQDEIYVIASGTSYFYRNGETIECKNGDVIFVPAGMEHRFVNFSEDFATWVIFY
ncbi:MAG: cupin domain-containing protein [Ferruginibacter sp.]|nr:cupin domain-containing protein [Ferruginibacter sp.]